MTAAANAPVRRAAQRENHSADTATVQRGMLDITESLDHDNVVIAEGPFSSDYAAQLAFNEEPVEILIYPGTEKFPAKVADCWVNGRGAEVFMNGKWVVLGYLPVNIPVITKRKYAETFANSKVDNITTSHGDQTEKDPKNIVETSTSAKTPFTITRDDSPYGREWLARLMRSRA